MNAVTDASFVNQVTEAAAGRAVQCPLCGCRTYVGQCRKIVLVYETVRARCLRAVGHEGPCR